MAKKGKSAAPAPSVSDQIGRGMASAPSNDYGNIQRAIHQQHLEQTAGTYQPTAETAHKRGKR